MLRIISLPNVEKYKKNRPGFNEFLRTKEPMIWKQMKHFNIFSEIQDEIFNSCRIKLWSIYQSKPNEKDGYYMVMLRNYITDALRKIKLGQQVSIKNELGIKFIENSENEDPFEMYPAIDTTPHLDGKILAEKLEKRLSNKAVDYLHQVYHEDFSINKGTKRKNSKFYIRKLMKKTYRYTNKELKIIEDEIRSEMAKLRANIICINKQQQYINHSLSRAIGEEI